MALTDNERGKKEKRTKSRAIDAGSNFRWSDKQKLEAVQSWLALGNLALTSRVLGIPEITLRVWKAQEWWTKVVEDIRLSDNVKLSARMKNLVEASQNIVAQRLETGDPVLNQKTGQLVYKPVSMKDAHKVAVDLIDRQKDVDRLTRDDAPTEQSDNSKLERLAERFAEMATLSIEKQINKKRTVEAEDAIFVDEHSQVYDEGEERGVEDSGDDLAGTPS